MLAAALSLLIAPLASLPQGPHGGALVQDLDVVAVRGRVEMSPAEALSSAREVVLDRARDEVRERGTRWMEGAAPWWMPQFVADEVLHRWLSCLTFDRAYRVVDRADEVHEHTFGTSYRTTLQVESDPVFMEQAGRSATSAMAAAKKRITAFGLGALGFWGVLAIGLTWLNRLSRGYMWKRLALIGTLLGVAIPAVALVA